MYIYIIFVNSLFIIIACVIHIVLIPVIIDFFKFNLNNLLQVYNCIQTADSRVLMVMTIYLKTYNNCGISLSSSFIVSFQILFN